MGLSGRPDCKIKVAARTPQPWSLAPKLSGRDHYGDAKPRPQILKPRPLSSTLPGYDHCGDAKRGQGSEQALCDDEAQEGFSEGKGQYEAHIEGNGEETAERKVPQTQEEEEVERRVEGGRGEFHKLEKKRKSSGGYR